MDIIYNFFTTISDYYTYIIVDIADRRTNDWYLVRNPIVFPIVFIYVYLVRKVGPRFMKHREPFELKTCLILYNFVNVLISIHLFKEGFHYGWFNGYTFICQPVDYSNNPKALRAAHACYWYYIAKLFELMDTMFFVLRKKHKQVTLLHVYHHSFMPIISWGIIKYFPGGHCTFIGFINCFTHIIMYTYYMLAAMGSEFQKYLWWKKYITTLQLLQFCLAFLHTMQLLFFDCGFPKWTTIFIMSNTMFFYFLFSDFYKKSYKPTTNDGHDNEVHPNAKIQRVEDTNNANLHNHAGTSTTNSENLNTNNYSKKKQK